MREDDLMRFKRSGGISHIGRPAMDLLDEIVRLAKLEKYPESIRTTSAEIRRTCNFSNQAYWNARDQLLKLKLIKRFEPIDGPDAYGVYFLNYEYMKNLY